MVGVVTFNFNSVPVRCRRNATLISGLRSTYINAYALPCTLYNGTVYRALQAYKVYTVVYGGPIGRAMCRLPCVDVHATIDDVDATIDDVDATIDDVDATIDDVDVTIDDVDVSTCARLIHGLRACSAAKETLATRTSASALCNVLHN